MIGHFLFLVTCSYSYYRDWTNIPVCFRCLSLEWLWRVNGSLMNTAWLLCIGCSQSTMKTGTKSTRIWCSPRRLSISYPKNANIISFWQSYMWRDAQIALEKNTTIKLHYSHFNLESQCWVFAHFLAVFLMKGPNARYGDKAMYGFCKYDPIKWVKIILWSKDSLIFLVCFKWCRTLHIWLFNGGTIGFTK